VAALRKAVDEAIQGDGHAPERGEPRHAAS